MNEFFSLITTVVKDWWLLGIAFGFGAAWLKGKQWIDEIHKDVHEITESNADLAKTNREFGEAAVRKLHQIHDDVKKIGEAVANHDKELIRNTEQHNAIVKALEAHVTDNKHHDQDVKQALAVIMDRLDRK
jgi:methyl-accepting chemotaxis protein